jgi:glycosyltransferase involved in cell wall biosynthesis
MKNLLLITDHFPPEQSGAVGRTYSLYKYSPLYGYNVIVITIAVYGKLSDEKNIYRFDSIHDWKQQGYFSRKALSKYISKFIGIFYINYDRYWENVINIKIQEILKNKIDIIYSTYPHSASLLIGYHLSKKYRIPLITEFRDGFLFEPIEKLQIIQKILRKKLEKKIILHSQAIITISKNISQYFQSNYPTKKTFTVYNGYDPDDFKFIKNKKKNLSGDKIFIAHFGQFNQSRKRDILPFIKALDNVKRDKQLNQRNFELSLIGHYTGREKKMIKKYKLDDIIKIYPPVPRLAGLKQIAAQYHFLLLVGVKQERSIITNKLFEYIKLNKPIIGICKGNEAETIIKKTRTGEVADFDTASIYHIFIKFLNKEYQFYPDQEEIKKFNRKKQVMKISQILDALYDEKR